MYNIHILYITTQGNPLFYGWACQIIHIAYAVHRKAVFMTLMINLATMFNEFDAIQQFASPVRVLYAPTDTIKIAVRKT